MYLRARPFDALFSLTDEETLRRVGNLLEVERDLSENVFASTEAQLRDIAARKPNCGDAYLRLAELYEHRVNAQTRLGVEYAKRAIGLMPEKKACHSVMAGLLHGYGGDWTFDNTLEMVRYYRALMKKAPDWQQGWGWLLDQLIGNGLLEEARAVVETTACRNSPLAKALLGDIAYARGNGEEALRLWQTCIDDSPDAWSTYAHRADRMVSMGRYNDAIRDYTAWLEKQPTPRFVDPCICLALLYEELGDIPKAIQMREEEARIYREEWHMERGEI